MMDKYEVLIRQGGQWVRKGTHRTIEDSAQQVSELMRTGAHVVVQPIARKEVAT